MYWFLKHKSNIRSYSKCVGTSNRRLVITVLSKILRNCWQNANARIICLWRVNTKTKLPSNLFDLCLPVSDAEERDQGSYLSGKLWFARFPFWRHIQVMAQTFNLQSLFRSLFREGKFVCSKSSLDLSWQLWVTI